MLAALTQGCLVGRSLYYVEEGPASTDDQLQQGAGSSSKSDAGPDGSPASSDAGKSDPRPPVSPPIAGNETCTAINVPCTKGGGMEYCVTISGNACTKLVYKHGGKSFECGCGGTDCTNAYYGAYTSCQDANGACGELATCCKAAPQANQPSCIETYNTYLGQAYGDVSCKAVLASFRASKICP